MEETYFNDFNRKSLHRLICFLRNQPDSGEKQNSRFILFWLNFDSASWKQHSLLTGGYIPDDCISDIYNIELSGIFATILSLQFASEAGLLSIAFISATSDPEASDKRIAPSSILPEKLNSFL